LEVLVNSIDQITVELVPDATYDVHALIGELDRILSAEYAPEQRRGTLAVLESRFDAGALGPGWRNGA